MKSTIIIITIILFFSVAPTAWAVPFNLPGTVYQGDVIIGKVDPEAKVWVKDLLQYVGSQGVLVLPVPRNQKTDIKVTVLQRGKKISHVIRVWAYPWEKQEIKGLPGYFVTPNKTQQKKIRNDNRKVQAVRRSPSYPVALFMQKGFVAPVKGYVTGPFGTVRILNGKQKNHHSGVDFATGIGTVVRAPANGIVRMTDTEMFLMGKTLMLDHGLGVYSIFIHLNEISVRVGDLVRQGEAIAEVGKTGRATGPHLHWGVSVGTISIDPLRLLNRRF
jgi:murein DD-endopeptidase MepM/ murein hydrolase activator NlpD